MLCSKNHDAVEEKLEVNHSIICPYLMNKTDDVTLCKFTIIVNGSQIVWRTRSIQAFKLLMAREYCVFVCVCARGLIRKLAFGTL